jgi:hypothetical protein
MAHKVCLHQTGGLAVCATWAEQSMNGHSQCAYSDHLHTSAATCQCCDPQHISSSPHRAARDMGPRVAYSVKWTVFLGRRVPILMQVCKTACAVSRLPHKQTLLFSRHVCMHAAALLKVAWKAV